jgi:hypothetical protein
MTRRRPAALALAAAAAVVLTGCWSHNDGRQLDPPELPLPVTTTTTSTTFASFVTDSDAGLP